MRRHKIFFGLLLIILFCVSCSIYAFGAEEFVPATAGSFEVASVFYDNMVFQQNEEIRIWGTSSCEGEYVNAKLGNSYGSGRVKNGSWEIILAPRTYSSQGQILEIFGGTGSEPVCFENIYIGDVWWVLGQSNVAFSASASSDWNDFINSLTGEENIFIHEIKGTGHDRWRKLNKYSGASSGALACFTAKKISDALQNEIPLGFMNLGCSGAELSQFMPPKLTKDVAYAAKKNDIYKNRLVLYEKFPIKGLIWYQGEADEPVHSVYAQKLAAFVEWLRTTKNQKNHDFPVYAVELPPCFNDIQEPGRQFAEVGAVRGETGVLSAEIKRFYVCSTSDLWKNRAYTNNIHPDNKMKIATRLYTMILAEEYGFGGKESFFPPQLSAYTISDDKKRVLLTFSEEIWADTLTGFLVIGENWELLPDTAVEICGKKEIIINSSAAIKIVRYNTKTENVFGTDIFLAGKNGLPVPAFSITFERPELHISFAAKVLNRLKRHKIEVFVLFGGMLFVFISMLLYRRRKRKADFYTEK